MPDDDQLTEEEAVAFDEARLACSEARDPRCIPLLLGAFGEGFGFGTYQLVEDAIRQFSLDEVEEHLVRALCSPHTGVRYWVAQVAESFTSDAIAEALMARLDDENADVRIAAATALLGQRSRRVRRALREACIRERDPEVRENLLAVIEGLTKGQAGTS